MTKEELAEKLNGREYLNETTSHDEATASRHGLVIVFGYSDDGTEFRGAIHDETGARQIPIHSKGILEEHEDCECEHCGYKALNAKCASIEAVWNLGDYSWQYRTSIPHATFEILDDGEKYCLGIVFSVSDLPVI